MKKIITVCAVLLMTASVFAQAPEKMSYQAVVRDASDALLGSTSVGMQISILQGSPSGTSVYKERQFPNTNANGLVSIEIGTGTVVSGDFTTIDWSNGPYFIKTETDPTGGANYTITGTSQLMSVPYALHAKTAETVTDTITETDPIFGASVASGITGTDTTNWNNKQDQLVAGTNITIVGNTINATGGSSNDFYLGQDTLGGIVFYIYIGSDGNQHGLIVNKNESTAQWESSGTTTNATRSWDGAYNTVLMTSSPAANYVNGLTDGGFTDWYLPSIDELSILWHNRFHANNALNAGGFTLLSNTAYYWSSTESLAASAFAFLFNGGHTNTNGKPTTHSVRAVMAF